MKRSFDELARHLQSMGVGEVIVRLATGQAVHPGHQVVARSTQGLLAWVFFALVEDQDWHDERADTAFLREAAEAAGFAHLDEVLRIQQQDDGDRPRFTCSL